MTEETPETPVINDPAAVLAALERAKSEAKTFREESETLRAQLEASNKENPWKAIALKNQVTLALAEKGIKNAAVAKYVNTADLDLDEEGNIAGLEDRITAASTEFPELFDVKRSVGGKADAGKSDTVVANKSTTATQVDALFR